MLKHLHCTLTGHRWDWGRGGRVCLRCGEQRPEWPDA